MWNGSVTLGDSWSTYVGPSDQNTPHAHVALQLAFGIDGPVVVHVGRTRFKGSGVLIGPLATHALDSGRHVALVYVEPQAALGRSLLSMLGDRRGIVLPKHVVPSSVDVQDPSTLVERLVGILGLVAPPSFDGRLTRALRVLELSRGGPGSIKAAALQVGLSEARLRSLARQNIGTPLSHWLLWRKLERAGRALAAGAPLADAAVAGSFSDQAHLARTMRRMFGITPRVAATVLR